MKIRNVFVNSNKEIIAKNLRELLLLFGIETAPETAEADYESLNIVNRLSQTAELRVETTMSFVDAAGNRMVKQLSGTADYTEGLRAAINRLVKLNAYRIMQEVFGAPLSPWGILHGVRPTKLVHKYMAAGIAETELIPRLRKNYMLTEAKASLLVEVAKRQNKLLQTGDRKEISVYIGIPFCLTRCLYCSFPSYILPTERSIIEKFWQCLKQDMLAVGRLVREHGLKVRSIYIGGGTPTSLPQPFFSELLTLTRELFFQAGTVEFTVEAGRPDSVDAAKITAMQQMAVSRVSVNPQTMQDDTLVRIGRCHTVAEAVSLFHKFRQCGCFNINMDLIIGLPGENEQTVADTMRQISALAPDNLTLHSLALKKGSRLKLEREQYALPTAGEMMRMFDKAASEAERMGMYPYYLYRQSYASGDLENIGYCTNGHESVYNIEIMEEKQVILGMGVSATTKLPDNEHKVMNSVFMPKDLLTYFNNLEHYIEKRREAVNTLFKA